MPADRTPRCSIVIPLYNHESYVRASIASVLNQSFQDFELIVVDDGSTDRSAAVVRTFDDDRISYVLQDNQGAHAAINRGISLARGDVVGILNSDDIYHRRRLEECLGALDADPALAAVFSDIELIDGGGAHLRDIRGAEDCWLNHAPETSFEGEDDIVLNLLAGNFLRTTSNLVCRKAVIATVGRFENYRYAHDYDFFLRLCSTHPTRVVGKPLLSYRVHERNTLSEDRAAVGCEVGLVLSRFFLSAGWEATVARRTITPDFLARFLTSLNTWDADRLILTLLLFGARTPGGTSVLSGEAARGGESPVERACIAHIRNNLDLRRRLDDTWQALQQTEEKIVNSPSYRIGRALTWPARRLLGQR